MNQLLNSAIPDGDRTAAAGSEECDVVVVGARCAGSAAASAFARAGRRVVVLDRARFPSDTLSTHLLFPTGVDELRRMGALERILALDPSLMRRMRLDLPGVRWQERFRDLDGIDYGICVPRPLQDEQLVTTARAHGAEVREGCELQELSWRGGRVAGVRYRGPDGVDRSLVAKLVVGADGRRSTVAALVGAWVPYRVSQNGRGLVFRYMDDPLAGAEATETMWQWRDGDSIAFAFPSTPRGRLLVLFMGPREEVSRARRDAEGYWSAKLAQHRGCAARVEGAAALTKLRSTADAPSFFRASSGPGWALAGDAGHFKDPVIGQGMRDAMWMGRTLAEAVEPVLDDGAELDRALRVWEQSRDRECLPAYHFANLETRIPAVPAPLIAGVVAAFTGDETPDLSDVFARQRRPQSVLTLRRMAGGVARALRERDEPARALLREAWADFGVELRVRAELRGNEFRRARRIVGSEHPGAQWPEPPRRAAPQAGPAAAPAAALAGSSK